MDLTIFNRGQLTRTAPELPPTKIQHHASRTTLNPTVLPPREKPLTPGMPVVGVVETGYSTAFWGEGKDFISFRSDTAEESLVSLCPAVGNEFSP
ncbi:hypothetical protein AVEN_222443-1 [Araneus ventricosus]|uniref:Uncharacterized protein n=1 Tax=Araneus ventricosus TaxID=182803 RepID=A0A4Y2UJL5_ARAVE|nr:hypothetical protein AVEN_222443-1 [Araneus ventricosus]